jgi:hypothetical protein
MKGDKNKKWKMRSGRCAVSTGDDHSLAEGNNYGPRVRICVFSIAKVNYIYLQKKGIFGN